MIEETNRFPWMKVSTETNAELKRGSKIEGVKLPPLFKGAAKYPTSDCVGSRIKKWEEEITQNFCGEVHCALMGSRFSGVGSGVLVGMGHARPCDLDCSEV